jgi:hypothetical protein
MLTVDATGLAKARLQLGWDEDRAKASIEASYGGIRGQAAFSIKARPVHLAFTLPVTTVEINDTVAMRLAVTNSVGRQVDAIAGWNSSNEFVARVDALGRVSGIATGVAFIRANVGQLADSVLVTVVKQSIGSLTFSTDTATLYMEESQFSGFVVRDVHQHIIRNPEVPSVISTDAAVVSIEPGAYLRGRGAGTARVIASMDGFADTMQVTVVPQFTEIASGTAHRCGITGKGAYCWGADLAGELGGETLGACPSPVFSPPECSIFPIRVKGGERFVRAAAGQMHTCALTRDGEAYCWGSNFYGELGDGRTTSGGRTPTLVTTASRFASIYAGGNYTCALTASGAAYCWGRDGSGQLGLGVVPTERCNDIPCNTTPAPVAGGLTFVELALGWEYACGRTAAGAIYCWGVSVGTDLYSRTPVLQAGGATFAQLVVSGSSVGGAICGQTASGGLSCWRYNRNGEFGNGAKDPLLAMSPVVGAGGRTFQSYSGYIDNVCGLDSDGAVWCWGSSYGTTPAREVTSVVFTRLAPSATTTSMCGITKESRMYCWGSGEYGQLGNGEMRSSGPPVRVRLVP